MKVKIIEPVSRFFEVGQVVEMTIVNRYGDFSLSTDKVSQSFGPAYHTRIRPITFEEFTEALITKIENEIIQEN